MKFGSLFDGIFGFGLGLERAGMSCSWRSEIDPYCDKVVSYHRPHIPNKGDIREIGRHNLEPVDLVCGGFPCQDLSVAGKRQGLDGERSGLWFEFYRVLRELRPSWVIVENVPGLLSSNGGRDFAVILQGLVELGYGACWRVLDAQYFGVAQRRRRVFVVGHLGDGRAAEVLFEQEGSAKNPREGKQKESETSPALAFSTTTDHYDVSQQQYVVNTNTQNSAGTRIQVNPDVSVTLQGLGGGMAAKTGLYAFPGCTVRRLTPIECERLQGFPDNWTLVPESSSRRLKLDAETIHYLQRHFLRTYGTAPSEDEVRKFMSDTQRYRQLGNAVCVNNIKWLGKRIVKVQNGS